MKKALYKGYSFNINDLFETRELTYQILSGLNDEEEIRQYWNSHISDNTSSWVYPMDMLEDYLDERDITALQVACRGVIDFRSFYSDDPFFIEDPFDGLLKSGETIDYLVCWTDDDDFLDFVWEEYIENDPGFYGVKIREE